MAKASKDLFMVVTLKSGVQLRFEVDEYTVKRNPLTNQFEGLDWTWTQPVQSNLRYVNPEEIAAVHSEWGQLQNV